MTSSPGTGSSRSLAATVSLAAHSVACLHRRVRHAELVEPPRPLIGVALGHALGEPRRSRSTCTSGCTKRANSPSTSGISMISMRSSASSSLKKNGGVERAHEQPHAVTAAVHPELRRHAGAVLVGAEGPEDPGQVDADRRVHRVHRVQPRHRERPHRAARRPLDQRRGDGGGAERSLLVGDDRHHRRHRVVAGGARAAGWPARSTPRAAARRPAGRRPGHGPRAVASTRGPATGLSRPESRRHRARRASSSPVGRSTTTTSACRTARSCATASPAGTISLVRFA